MTAPKFSAYPFDRLRTLTRAQARLESTLAAWLAASSSTTPGAPVPARLLRLVGAGAVRADIVAAGAFDPYAARCEVRTPGAALEVAGSGLAVRRIAQRLLGGPEELAAPRPLGVVEKSLWALVVATALEDLGIAGEVWPQLDDRLPGVVAAAPLVVELAVTFSDVAPLTYGQIVRGDIPRGDTARVDTSRVDTSRDYRGLGDPSRRDLVLAVQLRAPRDLVLRVPPARTPPWLDAFLLDVPIVLGRCALARTDLERLAPGDLVTLDRPAAATLPGGGTLPPRVPGVGAPREPVPVLSAWSTRFGPQGAAELAFGGASVGLRAAPGALEASVATGYVARDMSLPDDAHVELTVTLGTIQLSLRQLGDLALGQIVQLGRPLAGPFELRAAGRVVGRGELVDVDGELAVRIVSLGD